MRWYVLVRVNPGLSSGNFCVVLPAALAMHFSRSHPNLQFFLQNRWICRVLSEFDWQRNPDGLPFVFPLQIEDFALLEKWLQRPSKTSFLRLNPLATNRSDLISRLKVFLEKVNIVSGGWMSVCTMCWYCFRY